MSNSFYLSVKPKKIASQCNLAFAASSAAA
jgi:hypothetical protein